MSKTIIIILIFCLGKPAMSTSRSAQRHTAPSMRTLQLSPQMPSANALPHPGSSRRRDGSSSTPQAAGNGPAYLLAHALPEVLQLRPYHLPGSRCELVAEFVEVLPQTFSLGALLLLRVSLLLLRLLLGVLCSMLALHGATPDTLASRRATFCSRRAARAAALAFSSLMHFLMASCSPCDKLLKSAGNSKSEGDSEPLEESWAHMLNKLAGGQPRDMTEEQHGGCTGT